MQVFAEDDVVPLQSLIQGINIELQSPLYFDGGVSTELGGVISGADFRIQANQIKCSRKSEGTVKFYTVEASGSLIVRFHQYVLVGERLEYNFLTKTGVIYCGRAIAEPWFFGGSTIILKDDGSYLIENAFITTSENIVHDWEITADYAELSQENMLYAENMKLKVFSLPVFWIPSMHMNLDWIYDSPVQYNVKWGGNQGHRFGMVYKLFSWNNWDTLLRLDYRLKRGLGGGLESEYVSEDETVSFHAINYAARDSSIIHSGQRFRYRLQGVGDASFLDDRISMHLSYDKVSDIDMPTDFDDKGLDLETALRTEFLVHHQNDDQISNLITHVRINNFQTVKEELPTLESSWRPFELGNTGIISEMNFEASYLNFSYGNNQINVHNYTSTRMELSPKFYRHFSLGKINITPEAGGLFIGYGNSPDGSAKMLTMGQFGCNMNMQLWRRYDTYKHVVMPYINYTYYPMPTVSSGDHYVFDINDGWSRLNILRFGASQILFSKQNNGCIDRVLYADVYANAFFNTHTFSEAIPKAYTQVVWNPCKTLRCILDTGWDFMHHELDHFNLRTEWTINVDFAASLEYRHRSSFDWRKADHTNFIIDSYRTVEELRHSQLSDRRDTILLHFFYRFHPCWAFEVESRHGWNRLTEPAYNEFEVDLIGRLRSAMNVKFSYQHREDDDRISVYFSIGLNRPE